jgi:hypothetical protein
MDDDIWNIIMLCTILFLGAGLTTCAALLFFSVLSALD